MPETPALDRDAASTVHYTDRRVRRLAEASWRLKTGGSRADWLSLGKDNPEALIQEARDWIRAAVAAGILPPPEPLTPWKPGPVPFAPVYRAQCSGPCRRWLSLPDGYQPGEDIPHADLTARPTAEHAGLWPTEQAARRAATGAGWSGDRCPDCRPAPGGVR